MVQILLIDDHPSVMEGTKVMLEKEPDISVTAHHQAPSKAVERVRSGHFDLILIDLTMPEMNGIELSKGIIRVKPDSIILIYTGNDLSPHLNHLIEAGIAGFISKTSTQEEMLRIIRAALRREVVLPFSVFRGLRAGQGAEMAQPAAESSTNPLVPDELDIIRMIAEGKTNREIADQLFFSKRKLEYQLTQLFSKLNVKSRLEVVGKCREMGLLAVHDLVN
ncbi:response regulator transcription factor [Paenibacillus pinistramenti]|uniref:response regulator transcription factor n=1 Tax=Paenibacillus pinistramenti TaxID=1768003 RepID=UPI00110889B1|nr:response regulator transcription factor [Paenibacillus pinistramenti]